MLHECPLLANELCEFYSFKIQGYTKHTNSKTLWTVIPRQTQAYLTDMCDHVMCCSGHAVVMEFDLRDRRTRFKHKMTK